MTDCNSAHHQMLKAIINPMRDGLCALDSHGMVQIANPKAQKILGWSEVELVGRPFVDLICKDSPEDWRQLLNQIVETQARHHIDLISVRRKDGSSIPITLIVTPYPGGIMIHLQERNEIDSSAYALSEEGGIELKVAQQTAQLSKTNILLSQSLQRAERMAAIGALAAGVAHEINNPLTYIRINLAMVTEELLGFRELIEQGKVTEALKILAEIQQTAEEAKEGIEKVTQIVRDFKMFTRADAEEEHLAPVDLKEILDCAAKMAGNEIRHRAQLIKEYQEVPIIVGNGPRLAQVFLNILVNAAQAIREGNASANAITIRTSTDSNRRVVVEIQDTGEGIPPENLKRIFEPFFTTKPAGIGTGLGLAICQKIVRASGGQISVTSQPGRGTTFRVALPANPPAAQLSSSRAA